MFFNSSLKESFIQSCYMDIEYTNVCLMLLLQAFLMIFDEVEILTKSDDNYK